MWVLCCIITFLCVYLVEQTFHNAYLSVGLACLMGLTSGIFVARDTRRQMDDDE